MLALYLEGHLLDGVFFSDVSQALRIVHLLDSEVKAERIHRDVLFAGLILKDSCQKTCMNANTEMKSKRNELIGGFLAAKRIWGNKNLYWINVKQTIKKQTWWTYLYWQGRMYQIWTLTELTFEISQSKIFWQHAINDNFKRDPSPKSRDQ